MNRRIFIQDACYLSAGFATEPARHFILDNMTATSRQFRVCLNPFSIGVRASQHEILDMAIAYGFEAIIGIPQELEEMSPAELAELRDKMKEFDITWGASFLPVEFRSDARKFEEDLDNLPVLAEALANGGLTKTGTWIMPTHMDLTYRENFKLHRERLFQVARVLSHFGIQLGLEYVGPKTLMARDRHPFISSLEETRELIQAIGMDNVGFVLDSFHWYCAEESAADLLTLDKNEIVAVDLNDAKAGLTRDEQIDGMRELPGHSGVIDLQTFLNALVQIGYAGTVRAEPFNQALNNMDDQNALEATAAAMFRTVSLVE